MERRALWIAAMAALLGAALLHVYLRRYEQQMRGGDMVSVLALVRDVRMGETLESSVLGVRQLPERYLEGRHVRAQERERIVGARLTTAVSSGESLLWTDLDVLPEGRSLAGLVRKGQRAYALPARDASFEGLLRPGDRVDILWSAADGADRTATLLQNLLVLTVGGDLGEGQARKRGRRGRVTLSVTTRQAQLLAHAQVRGRLRLVVRNPQDLVVTEALPSTTDGDLAGQLKEGTP